MNVLDAIELYVFLMVKKKKKLCMSYHNLKRHRWGFLGGPVVKNLAATAGDTGSISEPGRSHIL